MVLNFSSPRLGFFSSFPVTVSSTASWESSNKKNNTNKYHMAQDVAFLFLALIVGFPLILKRISILNRSATSCLSLHLFVFFVFVLFLFSREPALLSILGGGEWFHNSEALRMGRYKELTSVTYIRSNHKKLPILNHFLTYKTNFIWFNLRGRSLRLVFMQRTSILLKENKIFFPLS